MSDTEYEDMRNRRRHVRVQISIDAMLEMGSCPAQSCQVFNMSAGGALVEHVAGARLGEPAVLHLDDFGSLRGHVARVSSTVMALAFEGHDAPALAAYIEHCRRAQAREREDATPAELGADPGQA